MEEQVLTSADVPEAIEKRDIFSNKKDLGIFGGIILLIIVLVGGVLFAVNRSDKTPAGDQKPAESRFIANGSIVYGYWKGKEAIIGVFDLSKGNNKVLAVLPTNVKHVKIVTNNTFTYISDTDQFDYGKNLQIHTINPASDSIVFKADNGFGIDDYVISPDGRLAALWVVEVPVAGGTLSGNKSRVYTLNLATGEKNLIYDEASSATVPVHYPVGITNSGDVFLDTFLPNSGAGWAYGMSTSDFKGLVKEDIVSMKNGTYSTQPVMSPDGSSFAFAGYEGLDGTQEIDTFRKALVNPNTVELLSVSDKKRSVIVPNQASVQYPLVLWDQLTGRLIISKTEKAGDSVKSVQYSYNTAIQQIQEIEGVGNDVSFFAFLQDKSSLVGQRFPGDSGGGNLGAFYSSGINKLSVVSSQTSVETTIPFDQLPIQLIAVKPAQFFPVLSDGKEVVSDAKNQQLSLQTFELKPTLVPVREQRQSTPVTPKDNPPTVEPPLCRTIIYPQCNSILGTNHPIDKDLGDLNDPVFSDCFWAQLPALQAKNTCAGSPLYLYGEKGTKVKVSIGTQISNPNILIRNNEFVGILDGSDNVVVEGTKVSSISFDYVPRTKRLEPPKNGYFVDKSELKKTLANIAKELQLNDKETEGLVAISKTIDAPYVFVSLYDNEMSQLILPLYFDPVPDVYRNIVFYFEGKNSIPAILPKKPNIDPINRKVFTAIEISYVVK